MSGGKQCVVSSFALVSWRAGRIEITSVASGATFATDDIELIRLVHAFAQPRTIDQVVAEFTTSAPEHIAARIDDLIRAGILISAVDKEAAAAHHWDSSALAYHRRSRQPGFRKMPEPTTAAVSEPLSENLIRLIRGSTETERGLLNVLDARRSYRAWPAEPIAFETFSRFFWMSARCRDDDNRSRPYPSGGAVYSLEIYPIVASDAVEGIAAGVYRYLPDSHCVETVSAKDSDTRPFLEAAGLSAGSSPPPIVLVITSRFARQSEIYGVLAYSLVLKEVGCLFQTFYLAAESLGLGPCALGGGTPAGMLAQLRGANELAEPVVGEFMLGPRSQLP